MSISVSQEDIDLLMSPDYLEIEPSLNDRTGLDFPTPERPKTPTREELRQEILAFRPNASDSVIEACIAVGLYGAVKQNNENVPSTATLVQSIDDLLNEDNDIPEVVPEVKVPTVPSSAPLTVTSGALNVEIYEEIVSEEEIAFEVMSFDRVAPSPRIVRNPKRRTAYELTHGNPRMASIWAKLDRPADVHRERIPFTTGDNWDFSYDNVRKVIAEKLVPSPSKSSVPQVQMVPFVPEEVVVKPKRKRRRDMSFEERKEANLERHRATKRQRLEDFGAMTHLPIVRSRPRDFPLEGPDSHTGGWRDVFFQEKVGREYAEAHCHLREPRYMASLTLRKACEMIKIQYFLHPKNPTQRIFEYKSGQSPPPAVLTKFINEVRACHFFSFDTESQGNLKRNGRASDRLFCSMSCPQTAAVMIFHDCEDIPQEIRDILADYAIAKIQSGIGNDVKHFSKIGIPVRGVVDSGTLFLLINPDSVGYGAEKQLLHLYPRKKSHVPYPWQHMPAQLDNESLDFCSKKHVVQDVLTPYAVLFEAARIRAEELNYQPDDDLMPIIQEALELCYSREPYEARNFGQMSFSSRNHWYPPITSTLTSLNDRIGVTLTRRARGNLVELHPARLTPTELKEAAHQIWQDRKIPGPNNKRIRALNCFLKMRDLCQNCGVETHTTNHCPVQKTKCDYPHYAKVNHPPHSTLMCPVLHSFCQLCKVRGHRSTDHNEHDVKRSPRQHRVTFMTHAHKGLYTSLPYLLSFVPGREGLAAARLTKMTYHAMAPARAQADLLAYLGLGVQIPEKMLASQSDRRMTTTENLSVPVYEYTSPDYFEKVSYSDDDADENVPNGAKETGGWWPE